MNTNTNMEQENIDKFIGFAIRCKLTWAEVYEAVMERMDFHPIEYKVKLLTKAAEFLK